MHQSYRFAIVYFCLFGALLLISGAVLFVSKLGLTYESIELFYLGNKAQFIQPKSTYGLLETALPHLGAMGLFIFVTGHFFLFTSKQKKQHAVKIVITLFAVALLDIFSGFLIVEGWHLFIWIKLAVFTLLQLLGLYLLWLLFKEAWQSIVKYK